MRNCTIVVRLVLLAGTLMLALVAVGTLAVAALWQSDQRLHAGHTRYTLPLVDLGALLSEVQHARSLLAAGLGGENSSVADSYYQQIKPTHERIDRLWADYKAAVAHADRGGGDLAHIEAALGANRQAADKVLSLARAGSFEDAMDQMRGDSVKRFDMLRAAMIETMREARDAGQTAFENASRASARARGLLLAALAFGLVAGAILTVLASRKVRAMLAESIEIAQGVAAGDLSRTIVATGNDETARLRRTLGEMQASLVALVLRVKSGALGVAAGSKEIALGNQDLSSRTEMQASALQQTAASMEQLNATVRQNAESARQANHLAQNASTVVARGGQVVDQVAATMKGIDESSKRIADIIGVIDGIAFQTNILALNAAVEAARAGEQGRGFAVVAGEVRGLAQRSAEAAKEIKRLIGASVERVEQGSTLADQAGRTMQEVQSSIGRVAQIVAEISAASAEQATGVDLVDRTLSQMDETTQQNAALVEQGAAAAESLRQQAAHLVEAVAAFRLAPDAEAAA